MKTIKDINWKDLKCEEASILSKETYIPCGQQAETLVWHNKDRRAYAMCPMCADHNLRNRGGILILANMEGV